MKFEEKKWWKEEIVYQIYPRSYMDSNGDGIGDIHGIIDKLDYIKSLGVTAVWLNPIYSSPCDDMGYDISDYRNILSDFGTIQDFEILLSEMHKRSIKLIMDLVVNHSSDEHAWFIDAKRSRDSKYHDYYIFKDASKGIPNNWDSYFLGSAWEYNEPTNEYFLHLFSKKQPDLNWENPQLRKEVYDLMKFWLEKGVDGFRMDVISLISKKPGFPDRNLKEEIGRSYANGPRLHEYLKEMNSDVLSKFKCLTVGECVGVSPEDGLKIVGYDRNELHMLFHFEAMLTDMGPNGEFWYPAKIELKKIKEVFTKWHKKLYGKAWNSIYLMNHDQPRSVSRFCNDGKYRKESSKLLATFQLSMCGTPYIYQGEEIGMTNCHFEPEEFRDIWAINYYREMMEKGFKKEDILPGILYKARDNSRTLMQWNTSMNSGFSSCDSTWIKVNPNYKQINVEEAEKDSDSILNYFRKMIALRKKTPALIYGDYELIDEENSSLYVYRRFDENMNLLVALNFSNSEQILKFNGIKSTSNILMFNYKNAPAVSNDEICLRAYEAIIIRLQ